MPDLTILYTNDLHGKLSDEAAEEVAREKSATDRCLLLDAGDAISSGNVYYRPGGEPMLAQMSELGYDAMAMGNREFHFLSVGLECKVKLARFPVLSANLRSETPETGPDVPPSITFQVGGLTVAVFGLSVPMITKGMVVSKISPFWFEDPIQAAKEIVPDLRGEADLLLGLTHIGLQSDMELAASVPGIDLIVGGHTHTALEAPKAVGGTSIVHAGSSGRYLGKAEVSLPATPGGRLAIRGTLIDLAASRRGRGGA